MHIRPSDRGHKPASALALLLISLAMAPGAATAASCTEAWLAQDDLAGTAVPLINGDFETRRLDAWTGARGEGHRPPYVGHDLGSATHVAVLAAEDARIEQSVAAPDVTSASTGTEACYVLRFRTRGVGPVSTRLRYELAGVRHETEGPRRNETVERFLAMGTVRPSFGWTEHIVLSLLPPMERATGLRLRLQRIDDHDDLTNLYVDDVRLTRLQRAPATITAPTND